MLVVFTALPANCAFIIAPFVTVAAVAAKIAYGAGNTCTRGVSDASEQRQHHEQIFNECFHWLILLFRLFLLFHPATRILTPSLDWPARLLVVEHKNCERNDSVIRLARRERSHCRSWVRESP